MAGFCLKSRQRNGRQLQRTVQNHRTAKRKRKKRKLFFHLMRKTKMKVNNDDNELFNHTFCVL
jgi:succinate dehydrogenase/fumarate reductase flavoprotein subunit